MFQEWAGVSPKQFLKSLTREDAVKRLMQGFSILDTSHATGLSGPGRLHDLLVTTDALSPGELKNHCDGMTIDYGSAQTPFGLALLAWNERGINFLGFCEDNGIEAVLDSLHEQWKGAHFRHSDNEAKGKLEQIFSGSEHQPTRVWLRGSPFQLKVWQALLAIPEGAHATYGQIAAFIGRKGASRAVGSAIGKNPVAWVIPCHRVIRQLGDLGEYRWGAPIKKAMIGYEAARHQN
jgi:AraC family transcriptional regulator of adaptative response/methylated-DNA-[protein]-cysteine methyltransferase